MQIDIISCVPELLEGPFSHSILKRAQKRGILNINIHDLREYGLGKFRQIDDYAYGGGAGMVLRPEPLAACIDAICVDHDYDEIIFLSPDGERLNQGICNELSLKSGLILISGHYKGIDERIRETYVTREISIGDYVLSGGELPAAVLVDAVSRLLPGVLNDETSALSDSFQDNLLAPPVYTRPAEFKGHKVPDVLLSGHDANIEKWRDEQSLKRTKERRPDLLDE